MDFSDEIKTMNYEKPLPAIKVSVLEISLSIAPHSIYTGAFTIQNQGGGELKGQILCLDPYIQCTPTVWEQNKQVCRYRIDTIGMEMGKTYKTSFAIISNGGEIFIPVFLAIGASTEWVEEPSLGWENIEEFTTYAKSHWEEAVVKFNSEDFFYWLSQTKNQSFLYQHVKKEFSPAEAMDAFFIGAGLKKPSHLALTNKKTNIRVAPGQTAELDYVVEVQKEEWGHIKARIQASVDWIQLWKEDLTNEDFDQQGRGHIPFRIIPPALQKSHQTGILTIETWYQTLIYEINVIKTKEIDYRLSKKSFQKEDKGELIITNHTGGDLVIHIRSTASWVQFEAKKYLIAKQARIPFSIHFTSWDKWMSQMFSNNHLFQQADIIIQTQIHKKRVQETIRIIMGPQIIQL